MFALRLDLVREAVPMAALARPPSMPAVLEGVLNLRGVAVPVMRLAFLLGLPQDALDLHTPLVVMRGPAPMALLVHRIVGIAPVSGFVALPDAESLNGCVEGQLTIKGTTVQLLAAPRLLLEKESRALAHFQAAAETRLQHVEARAQ